jgi:hypothetical protein
MDDTTTQTASNDEPSPDDSLKIGDIELHPVTLLHLWMLEDLKHPLISGGFNAANFGARELSRAVYVFADAPGARKVFATGGADAIDEAAKELAASIRFTQMPRIVKWMIAQIASCAPKTEPDTEPAAALVETAP